MRIFLGRLRDSWRDRANLGDGSRQQQLVEFYPAALEIQETPPHPLARWLALSLAALFTIAIVWACFGHVDVVATAEGKIIPSARVKFIQPLSKGFVKTIHVKEGQSVKQGDALIELDRTVTAADNERMEKELRTAIIDLAGAKALYKLLTAEKFTDIKPAAIKLDIPVDPALPSLALGESETHMRQQMVWEQWHQYRAQLGGLQGALQRVNAELTYSQETIKKLQQTLPMITKRAESVGGLYKKQMASEAEFLELEQQRIERSQDLAAELQRSQQASAGISEAEQQIKALKADSFNRTLTQISDTTNKVNSLRQELIKAKDIDAKQILYAPVSGYVQELSINTIGGIVTEAQKLMIIVPEEEALEIEVKMKNDDIGFVEKDMLAEVKIHTFPFTKYGLIDATVSNISDDAIVDEKLGLVYSMNLMMHKSTIQVGNKVVKLMPGMAVTAEVKTDKRRVIEYFLAPLLRYRQESIRER